MSAAGGSSGTGSRWGAAARQSPAGRRRRGDRTRNQTISCATHGTTASGLSLKKIYQPPNAPEMSAMLAGGSQVLVQSATSAIEVPVFVVTVKAGNPGVDPVPQFSRFWLSGGVLSPAREMGRYAERHGSKMPCPSRSEYSSIRFWKMDRTQPLLAGACKRRGSAQRAVRLQKRRARQNRPASDTRITNNLFTGTNWEAGRLRSAPSNEVATARRTSARWRDF